jgi:crotonobetainyl-CoA:carnitine CoA-transferase CaiB-like acyl-CoA transferase
VTEPAAVSVPPSVGDVGMLAGCKVLDLSQYLAGPGATRLLAELGAEIIKVELAPDGDSGRLLPWVVDGRSGFFVQHNRGKQSLCVDWSTAEGLELIRRLATGVDIVVENFGTRETLQSRGLDYDSVRVDNPALIYLSISAFGRQSPWADKPGFDYVVQAASGLMHMAGEPDRSPAIQWAALGDCNAAVHGFAALGFALYHRERTGEGQYIDLAMTDCLFHFVETALEAHHLSGGEYVAERYGVHHRLVFPAGNFRGPEGWITVLALHRQWPNVCEAIGRPDLVDDPRYARMEDRARRRDELVPIVESWMAGLGTDDAVVEALGRARVPACRVLSPVDAIGHPHFEARGMIRWIDDPIVGRVPVPGFPFKFGAQPGQRELRAPLLGEHNRRVLVAELGLTDEQIDDLAGRGVLVEGEPGSGGQPPEAAPTR